jgi:hypothetical protein
LDGTLTQRRAGKAEMNLDPDRITASRANRGSSVEIHCSTRFGAGSRKEESAKR